MRRIISFFLIFMLVLTGLGTNEASAAQFSDVPSSHGFYKDITYLLEKGVISQSSKYGVDEKVTRAEVAVMVSKAIGLDGTKRTTQFKDVSASHAASGYIDSAVKAGVIKGFSDGTFKPSGIVDRGEMAIFLARAFELKIESSSKFSDVTSSMASYSSIQKIVHAKITTGFSNKTFRPTEKLTRGQISAFIARSMQIGNVSIPVAKEMKVHFIDVGQGDSVLIQSPSGKNMLIDGGTKGSGTKVVNFLKSKGVSTLDVVVATHPDADHIGGLITVLNNFKVNQFIDSGKVHTTQTYYEMLQLIDDKNIPFKVAKTGDNIALDVLLSTTVLYADENASSTNGASVVARILYGSVSFLLTGDAGAAEENKMLTRYGDLKSTYLKAGHHGSNSSSTAAFLNSVKPTGAIFSYGEGNQYGHPHAEVVSRLNALGSKIYSTAQSGDITVTTNGTTHSVSAKFWTDNVTPKPEPKPEPPKPDLSSGLYVIPGAPTSFQNCTAMKIYYPYGVRSSHPAYESKHDRDKDGWACE